MGDPQMNENIERIQAARRRKILRRVFVFSLMGLVAALMVGGVIYYSQRKSESLPGVAYETVGREHIGLNGAPPQPYNSNPPSSGGHFSTSANWGVYDYEVEDKIFIHNLEHGGVWIAYRPNIPPAVVEALKGIVNEFGGSKLVMAPRSANDSDIAVVSWGHVFKINLDSGSLSESSRDQIRQFYKAFKNRGPEFVPDTVRGIDPKSAQ
ncbi:MAG: DUF3105 domain-containing protein [Candidatus Sungbacteria bacterium]|uniref:DUF3105 domain-containing protein n=1 Tax=Candidatus Sungiibacteriota bacterium TaxID=2750080 RepID=A0A931WPJ3_9BACT|nr:DUF3105 domain-containing protein [Candidatus Sungbacteria bacterium]